MPTIIKKNTKGVILMDSIKSFADDYNEHGELNEEKLMEAIRKDFGFHEKVIKFILSDLHRHLSVKKDLVLHLTEKISTTQTLIHTMRHANING